MIKKVFAILDTKAEAFLPPFMMHTVGEAERALSDCCSDPQHNFCKFAEDFNLYELGTWNDSNAFYDLHSSPRSIGLLTQYKRYVASAE